MNAGQAIDALLTRVCYIRRTSWKDEVALGMHGGVMAWFEAPASGSIQIEPVTALPVVDLLADDWEVIDA